MHVCRLRQTIVAGAMAFAIVVPAAAHAQFDVNLLSGKKFNDVKKILGTPLKTAGSPITFSRFKTNGAVDTKVWYSHETGEVGKVQMDILAKPGETAADACKVLKRYQLSIGSNPKIYTGTKAPCLAMVSSQPVAGMPWKKVYISLKVAQTYKPETVKYCKEHNLDPNKTYFWMVMVRNAKHWKPWKD